MYKDKENSFRLYTSVIMVVFICSALGAGISLTVAEYWQVDVQILVILWVLFAVFLLNVLASVVGLLNLKSLERHLGIVAG